MLRIALLSLLNDRSKLAASVAGVVFAATLTFVQHGLYQGFLYTSSAMISRMGGDAWVMATGTEVLDSVESLSPLTRSHVISHPCVARVRPLVFNWSFIRKGAKTRDTVRVVGIEPTEQPYVPWELAAGLPHDLLGPMRIAVDEFDLPKLQISGQAMGAELDILGQTVRVAAITRGVRSFTLLPFVFANVENARRLTNMADGEVNYWVVDLKDQACLGSFEAHIARHPQLRAEGTSAFVARSQNYWINGSGVGAVLSFATLLALLVGGVIIGQTLYTITKDHKNELATLKAIGASGLELVGFTGWQAFALTTVGTTMGLVLAWIVSLLARSAGLIVALSWPVILTSCAIIATMSAVSSLMSIWKILKLDAAEVFK